MKTTLKVLSIIAIVLGSLAVLDSLSGDAYSLIAGLFYIAYGVVGLAYIGQQAKRARIIELNDIVMGNWPLQYKMKKDGKKTK